jgi:hypothetical protein
VSSTNPSHCRNCLFITLLPCLTSHRVSATTFPGLCDDNSCSRCSGGLTAEHLSSAACETVRQPVGTSGSVRFGTSAPSAITRRAISVRLSTPSFVKMRPR